MDEHPWIEVCGWESMDGSPWTNVDDAINATTDVALQIARKFCNDGE